MTTTPKPQEGTMKISLERVEQPSQESLVFGTTIPGKAGWVATIELADGGKIVADRIDGEDRWLVNGEWAPGRAMPRFWNGQLSRCTIPKVLAAELVTAVEGTLALQQLRASGMPS